MDEKIKETKRQAYFFALNPKKRFHGNISVIKYCQRYVSRLRSRANHRKRVSSHCKHPHKNFCAISQYAVYTIKMSEKIESFSKIVITDSQKVIPSFFRLFSNTFWTFFRKTPMV